jgi:gluconokinase
VTVDPDLLRQRVQKRSGHYMPPSLLDSQRATLEPLQDDEPGASISGAGTPDAVVEKLLTTLSTERCLRIENREAPS